MEKNLTKTDVLSTHTPALFQAAVIRAAELLRLGEVVALPTETVYGLAANALDARAVQRIYTIKGRPALNPIIVHVADLAMARRFAAVWPKTADDLAAAFWPGPLTLVVARSKEIPDVIAAGGPTVGLRWPSHPFIRAVIRECGFPLAAPSANPSNQISPTNSGHVLQTLGGLIPLIVDGGQSQVGIESTVVDVSVDPPRLLRPGMIHGESLRAVVGDLVVDSTVESGVLRSPGQLTRHYSPRAKLIVLDWGDESQLKSRLAARGIPQDRCHVLSHTRIPLGGGFHGVSVIPHDAEAFARALYGELHECDRAGAGWIVVEQWPESPEWQAIGDRLNRASVPQ